MSFQVDANKPFFIALFGYASLLGRRGCHRTAAEVLRLLLALDPELDPKASLLCFDYFCLRTTEPAKLLIPFVSEWESAQHLSIFGLPSYAYSTALAKHLAKTQEEESPTVSIADLKLWLSLKTPFDMSAWQLACRALLLYPTLFHAIAKHCGYDNIDHNNFVQVSGDGIHATLVRCLML